MAIFFLINLQLNDRKEVYKKLCVLGVLAVNHLFYTYLPKYHSLIQL